MKFRCAFLLILVFITSCDRIRQYRKENSYNPDIFENYIVTDIQDSLMLRVICFLDDESFDGQFGITDDSLNFGYIASDKIDISDNFRSIFKKYNLGEKIYHRNGFTYFQLRGGFIDDNCGILFLPDEIKMPVQVRSKRYLRKSNFGNGNWYFVETKL